jgi:hypothetical protein
MKKKTLLLMLFLMFISTNALSQNIIHGRITGDVQAGISVELYKTICGSDVLVDTFTTNSEGYYAFGCLDNGDYRVAPKNANYTFSPEFDSVQIPQTIIQSYDFTAHNLPFCVDNSDCIENGYCFKEACADIRGTCEVRSEICTDEYDPVCGCNFITYSNACYAAGNGVSVAYTGECF